MQQFIKVGENYYNIRYITKIEFDRIERTRETEYILRIHFDEKKVGAKSIRSESFYSLDDREQFLKESGLKDVLFFKLC